MGKLTAVPGSAGAVELELRRLMQTLTSLVSLQARRVKSAEARQALDALMARFEAIAANHGRDAGGGLTDLAAHLEPIAKRAAAALDAGTERPLVLSLPPIHMEQSLAASLGQIAAELLIGAYHAADLAKAPVHFRLSAEEGLVELSVETGEEPVLPTGADDEDDEMDIVSTLVRGLGGTLVFARERRGFAARARIPLD